MEKTQPHNQEMERRFFASEIRKAERADNDETPVQIEGYAALYNSPTEIGGWFREVILPGAFDKVMDDDVRALFNHDANLILGRTKSGTLKIWTDDRGLKFQYTSPDRSYAKDLEDSIDKGDVDQCSFAFQVDEVRWVEKEGEMDTREIVSFKKLYDVSPVTYPAYADTSVAKRSYDSYITEKAKKVEVRDADKVNTGLTLAQAQLNINKNLF